MFYINLGHLVRLGGLVRFIFVYLFVVPRGYFMSVNLRPDLLLHLVEHLQPKVSPSFTYISVYFRSTLEVLVQDLSDYSDCLLLASEYFCHAHHDSHVELVSNL